MPIMLLDYICIVLNETTRKKNQKHFEQSMHKPKNEKKKIFGCMSQMNQNIDVMAQLRVRIRILRSKLPW